MTYTDRGQLAAYSVRAHLPMTALAHRRDTTWSAKGMSKGQDAIGLLTADHAAVKKLFAQEETFSKRDSEKKVEVFNEIAAALEVHATIEEEIFYPAVKKARSEHVKDEVREGYEEHKQIKTLLETIASITPADESYDMKIKVLKEDVEHHVKDEEGDLFPDAKQFLSERRLVELGAELGTRRQQLKQRAAAKRGYGNQARVNVTS
jgi:hemerythrin superfamily protein